MSKINSIRKAIETLSDEEYTQLRQWFSERDWEKWDQEIEKDSKSGKLDFLIHEAFDDKRHGKQKALGSKLSNTIYRIVEKEQPNTYKASPCQ